METNGFQWVVAEDFACVLAQVLATHGEVIKESPAKKVTRCQCSGRGYFIKRYRHASTWFRPIKFLFRESPAKREWQLAQELQARGVPAVVHLAHGERRHWTGIKESILITAEFAGRPVQPESEEEVRSVMDFVDGMHAKGVIQHDLHAANLLCNPLTGEICLVDLYGIEIKPSLGREERDRNFATLGINFQLPLKEPVLSLSQRLRKKALLHRSRRAWKHNQEFYPMKFGKVWWHIRRPLLSSKVAKIFKDPDGFLTGQTRILKSGRSATVGASEGMVMKRFNFVKPLRVLKGLFRHSHALRSFRLAYHLELTGIRTPKPIAAGTERFLGFPIRSFFLMEEIVGARSLGELQDWSESLVIHLATLLARLHEEGFYHRDLKVSNLVLDKAGRVVLLDLEGLHFCSKVPQTRARADLRRLALSASSLRPDLRNHELIFLKHYCRCRKLRPSAIVIAK